MATRDELLFAMVGGFRKSNVVNYGHEVRVVGTYGNGIWRPDQGTENITEWPLGGVLEIVVENNVEDEDLVIELEHVPVSFTGYSQYQTNLGSYDLKRYGWCAEPETRTFTIPAFTRAGKIIVEDDDGDQCVDFGKFQSITVNDVDITDGVTEASGIGMVTIHEILTEGGKLVQALKPFDLLDILYLLKQSVSKGPRPCPRCKGAGADSDYKTRLKTRSDELVAVNGYSPSLALIYAEEETKFCALCEGKRFLKDDHEIPEFLLDNFLDWQGAPYSGKSLPDKIAMAFVCSYNCHQSEDGIANFLSKVFDVEPSSVFFSSDVCAQNVVVYIGFKGQPGPNSLFPDREHFQWILDTIRPVGIEYFAADSISDFEEDWSWIDTMDEFLLADGQGEEFHTNDFDEVPATWFATTMGEQCNRFEDKFEGSFIKEKEMVTGILLSGMGVNSGEVSFGYHPIGAIRLETGSVVTKTLDMPNDSNWEMVFMFMPTIGTTAKIELRNEPR